MVACGYCGSSADQVHRLLRHDGREVVECLRCGLLYLADDTGLAQVYDRPQYFHKGASAADAVVSGIGYTDYGEKEIELIWQALIANALLCRLARAKAVPLEELSALDVGCGYGAYLRLLKIAGIERCRGVDLSTVAVATAQSRGLDVVQGSMADLDGRRQYHLVTAFDVLEHHRLVRRNLSALAASLADHGVFLLSTPDATELSAEALAFSHSLEHVAYFRPAFLAHALHEAFGQEPVIIPWRFQDYPVLVAFVGRQDGWWQQPDLTWEIERILQLAADHAGNIARLRASGEHALRQRVAELETELSRLQDLVARQKDDQEQREAYIAALEQDVARVKLELESMRQATTWRVLEPVRRVADAVKGRRGATRQPSWAEGANPYDALETLRPIVVEVVSARRFRDRVDAKTLPAYSVVITTRNEGKRIIDTLRSIEAQTQPPLEVIVTDGGSTDDTVAEIERFRQQSQLSIRLLRRPGCSIAEGRNVGVAHAAAAFVVCTDAGCVVPKEWGQCLVGALAAGADLACGTYHSATSFGARLVWNWQELDFQRFLPSARNVAFCKELWAAVGGYPEWLTKTGEDTLFDIACRRRSKKWTVFPDLAVLWEGVGSARELRQKTWSYGYGDGESGYGLGLYYPSLRDVRVTGDPPRLELGRGRAAAVEGFLAGLGSRLHVLRERRGVTRVWIILSGVPFTDSGGGQRAAQIAMEVAAQAAGCVWFVNLFPSYEPPGRVWMDVDLSLLELWRYEDFERLVEFHVQRLTAVEEVVVLVEFPERRALRLAKLLKERLGAKLILVSDTIDLWEGELGGDWYAPEVEKSLLQLADVRLASATHLVDRAERLAGGLPVIYVPNAANRQLFCHGAEGERPDAPTPARPTLLYHGALWGGWLNWQLVFAVADALPDCDIVLIGGGAEKVEELSRHPNVRYLGLKQQHELPSYIRRCDAGIVPFTVTALTDCVSPIKIFEYLAMGKPVVTTDFQEARVIHAQYPDLVWTAEGEEEFVRLCAQVARRGAGRTVASPGLEVTWLARVRVITEAIAQAKARGLRGG